MTPKEKAKELYSKFEDAITGLEGNEWWSSSKQCALIAVDEIINDCDASSPFETTRLNYWNEVKTEINNL